MNAFYNIAWYVTRVAMALWFDIRIEGRENIPEQGGALVVCNHRFLKDPVVLAHAIPPRRKLHFMSKAEWFDNKPFGLLLSALGVFPINRGEADMAALEKAAGFIRGGDLVGIFPEGTRSRGDAMGECKNGGFRAALKAGVPVVPVVIDGTYRAMEANHMWIKPASVKVQVLEPIPTRGMTREESKQIGERVRGLIAAKKGEV